ncbi:MAG: hypothetical protein ACRESZ_19405 [Methylococcales bacterium]
MPRRNSKKVFELFGRRVIKNSIMGLIHGISSSNREHPVRSVSGIGDFLIEDPDLATQTLVVNQSLFLDTAIVFSDKIDGFHCSSAPSHAGYTADIHRNARKSDLNMKQSRVK